MAKTEDLDYSPNLRILLRSFVIELVLYGTLVVVCFLTALRDQNDLLNQFFQNNLMIYAFLALLLIVVQGVFLDGLTSVLLHRIKLERLE